MPDLKSRLMRPKVEVGRSSIPNSGYGVFSTHKISAGELVEECPYFLVPNTEERYNNYAFKFGENHKMMVLGYGCVYNHKDEPNLEYGCDEENRIMFYRAIKDIEPGEECFICYGETWFSSRNASAVEPLEKRQGLFGIPYLGEALLVMILIFAIVHTLLV